MRMYLINDNISTCTDLRLTSVKGVAVHEKEQLKEGLDRVMAGKEVEIVLLTEKFNRDYPDLTNQVELNEMPLFVEIPDRHGIGHKPSFITSYTNEAIGLEL